MRLETLAAPEGCEDLVLIHGWGVDSRLWQALLPELCLRYRVSLLDLPGFGVNADISGWQDEQGLLDTLAQILPRSAHLVGWSLGGNLALAYAHTFPERVLSLTMLCSNLSFVQRDDWPHAMARQTFSDFAALVDDEPDAGVSRFRQLLVQGHPSAKQLLRQLRAAYTEPMAFEPAAVKQALAWLGHSDQRAAYDAVADKCLLILGDKDSLVPVEWARGFANARVIAGAGHLPLLSHPQVLLDYLTEHMASTSIDKIKVARSFSAAAESYDQMASLQREVGNTLLGFASPSGQVGRGLDLGCGTGFMLPALRQKFGPCDWHACDLAEGMLVYLRDSERAAGVPLSAMDAEQLAFANASFDLVYSNLALQWCFDLPALFAEFKRVTRPDSRIFFSTLLDGTLAELKTSWGQVDQQVHVNRFLSGEQWQQSIENAGLKIVEWHGEKRTMEYQKLAGLTRELKGLGAHNVNAGSPRGLVGKKRWQKLNDAYEQFRQANGKLPASYQLAYGVVTHA